MDRRRRISETEQSKVRVIKKKGACQTLLLPFLALVFSLLRRDRLPKAHAEPDYKMIARSRKAFGNCIMDVV